MRIFSVSKNKRILFVIHKTVSVIVIFSLVGGWLFSGWPKVWNGEDLKIPPETQSAEAAVPSGVIVAWPGTAASIPSGWSRVTALDTYYLEGTTSDPSSTPGGSADHSHTSPTHTHDVGHTHSGTIAAASGGSNEKAGGGGAAESTHTHLITTDANSGNNNPASANFGTASNNPPYTEVIWIKSDGSTDIPAGAWSLFNSDTLPTNWSRQSGNRFLKGAAASGDGGSTGGTSDAHTHTDSGHTHTENAHTHTGTSGIESSGLRAGGSGTFIGSHTHSISETGSATATEQSGNGVLANGDGQPPFYKLNIIQNDTLGADLPMNAIAMWDGSTSSVPSGWEVCDGSGTCPNLNNYFTKGAANDSEIGTTGGALSHTHSAGTAHSHTINSHTHTFSVSIPGSANEGSDGSGKTASLYNHAHPNVQLSGGGTTGTETVTADANTTGTNVPPYKEIVYIMYVGGSGSLSVDIVDSGGSPVSSPSVTFPTKNFSWSAQTSDATLGTASEKIRVSNTTGTPTWTLEIAATSGATAVWNGGSYSYDFNDSAANGRLEVDASGATITPEGGCSSTGLSKGTATYFAQGSTDSITILSAGGTADAGCYWDYTGIDMTQDIPASQEADTYTIDMTLTVS